MTQPEVNGKEMLVTKEETTSDLIIELIRAGIMKKLFNYRLTALTTLLRRMALLLL